MFNFHNCFQGTDGGVQGRGKNISLKNLVLQKGKNGSRIIPVPPLKPVTLEILFDSPKIKVQSDLDVPCTSSLTNNETLLQKEKDEAKLNRNLTPMQRKVLEDFYTETSKFPRPEDHIELSNQIGRTEQSVVDWFTKRRVKSKLKFKSYKEKFTRLQLILLEASFKTGKYLCKRRLEALSHAARLSKRQINIWYEEKTKEMKNNPAKKHVYKNSTKELPSIKKDLYKNHPFLINDVQETIRGKKFPWNNEPAGISKLHNINSYGSYNLKEESINSKNDSSVCFEVLSDTRDQFGQSSSQNNVQDHEKICQLDNDDGKLDFPWSAKLASSSYSYQDNKYGDEHDYKKYLNNPTIEKKKQDYNKSKHQNNTQQNVEDGSFDFIDELLLNNSSEKFGFNQQSTLSEPLMYDETEPGHQSWLDKQQHLLLDEDPSLNFEDLKAAQNNLHDFPELGLPTSSYNELQKNDGEKYQFSQFLNANNDFSEAINENLDLLSIN